MANNVMIDDIPGLSPGTATTKPAAPAAPATAPAAPPTVAPEAPPAPPTLAPEAPPTPPAGHVPTVPLPVTNADGTLSAPEALPEAPAETQAIEPEVMPSEELDIEGMPWDARIHSSGKTKYQSKVSADKVKGAWTHKRGVDPALVAEVKAELRPLFPETEAPVETPSEVDVTSTEEAPEAPPTTPVTKTPEVPPPAAAPTPAPAPETPPTAPVTEKPAEAPVGKEAVNPMVAVITAYKLNIAGQLQHIMALEELMIKQQDLSAEFDKVASTLFPCK